MAKILSIDDMLEAANRSSLPSYDQHLDALEKAATALAQALADQYGIRIGETTWEGKEFGGLCASFYPRHAEQDCPNVIDEGDPGGDWEMRPVWQHYEDGKCPDCGTPIPTDVVDGAGCANCGHVFHDQKPNDDENKPEVPGTSDSGV